MKIKDYFLTQEEFEIEEDKIIKGWWKTKPVPDADDLARYYESDAYLSHQSEAKNFFSYLYQFGKEINARLKYIAIQKELTTQGKVLDYGCGVGDFAHFLEKKSYELYGVEPNQNAAQQAAKKLQHAVIHPSEFTKTYDRNYFDSVMMWHVLEHIEDPAALLQILAERMKPSGKMIVALPNYLSWDAKHYKEHWAAWDVPRHLHHWCPTSFKQFAEKNGFTLYAQKPMYLDAFYVAKLSEEYDNQGNKGLLKAFFKAVYSNYRALDTANFSSIIYFLKRNKL